MNSVSCVNESCSYRETMERVNLAPGDPQDLPGLLDQDSDLYVNLCLTNLFENI